ncbi:uncharacterized protein [Linepithema humile]|uniref:uncharacterized protein n=1 Tax=Linepithema humile TaxID=83485 RepID=UPI00351E0DA5
MPFVDVNTDNCLDIVNTPLRQLDNIETCKQRNDYSQLESASDSGVNSVSDGETEILLANQNGKKRQLSSKLEKSKRYPKRLALWFTRTQFQELNIEKVIKEHLKGDAVLIYYKNNGILNGEARGILIEILASCMIKININPTFEEFQIVSKKLCELFPTETEATYVYEPFANGPKQKNIGGKLADKVRNIKSMLRRLGALNPANYHKYSNSTQNENDENEPDTNTSKINEDKVQAAIRWLKISREPWTDVLNNWDLTYDIRQKTLLDPKGGGDKPLSVTDYFSEWEVLSLPQGYTLLDRDFKKKYPDKDLALLLEWEIFIPLLKQLLKAEVKDSYGKAQLKKLDELDDANSVTAVILHLLPHLVPPRQLQKLDSGEKIKANIAEARDAFVFHVTVPGDINPAIQRRRAVALKLKTRVQPFVLLVGPTVEQYEICYVIIDEVKYQFNNVLKAFDQCFKAIQVLMTEYSYEARGVWLFIQQALYRISTRYDKKNSNVSALVKTFEALRTKIANETDNEQTPH